MECRRENRRRKERSPSGKAKKIRARPRDLVVELVKKNPEADRKALFATFREMLEESGDDYKRAVEWYFFVNMYDYLVVSRNRTPDPIERTQQRAEQRERIEAIKAQIVMLDLTMPNGKACRVVTFRDLLSLGHVLIYGHSRDGDRPRPNRGRPDDQAASSHHHPHRR